MTAPSAQDLRRLVDALADRPVLVVGDLMLDQYLWGEVRRISPTAPVPVVRQRRATLLLGGAANVARNLAAAGARAAIVGIVGGDEAGRTVRRLLGEMKIRSGGVLTDGARPTTLKTTILAHGQQLLRLDIEEPGEARGALQARLLCAVRKEVAAADAVILSDYAKGIVHGAVIEAAVRAARARGVPIVADPKSDDFARYRGVDYLTPNLEEAALAAGRALEDEAAIEREGRRLLRRFGGKGLIVTRSGEGFSLITARRHARHPAQAREVFDATGCGDTFIAHLALGLAAGWEVEDAAMLANTAAAVTIGKVGAATVSREELDAALGGAAAMGKIRTAEDLALLVERLRNEGRRIVFTNGCFDLIHTGHIQHLHEARALGDVLIVALNTDRSVRRVKGPPRPVLGEHERAAVLAALDDVSYVTFFDEDTPDRLLKMLRPDVLVKGRVPGRRVVGADIVEAYGGRVVELGLFEGASTDALLRKIREGGDRM
jgi:D-beta-D-heptose 7-phosphate kinase/D-beta-D-heptose 1-phosphate adenosyltransferase